MGPSSGIARSPSETSAPSSWSSEVFCSSGLVLCLLWSSISPLFLLAISLSSTSISFVNNLGPRELIRIAPSGAHIIIEITEVDWINSPYSIYYIRSLFFASFKNIPLRTA